MKTLVLGEVVGRAGFTAVKNGLKTIKDIDVVIANGEGISNGYGITKLNAINLMKCGVDVITCGEKTFYKKDMLDFIKETSKVLRPYNYPIADTVGKGIKFIKIGETNIAIINILGVQDMHPILNNPFTALDYTLNKIKETCPVVIVIFHASASAEKQTMFHYLDGKVTAVIGTHTKVLTADSVVSEKHTAYITDNGRCGSTLSVGGFDAENEIKKQRTNLPVRSKECFDDVELQGVIVEFNEKGEALSISPIKQSVSFDPKIFEKKENIIEKNKLS